MASDGSDKPYEVGREKPPTHTRFRPGQSGNRSGRPKGSRNFATILRSELQQRVTVTIDGRRRRITKRELFVKQLVNKAVAGDPKVMPVLLNEIRAIEAVADIKARRLTQKDRPILKNIIKRIRASSFSTDESSSDQEPGADGEANEPDAEENS